jgi:hypothetical protein
MEPNLDDLFRPKHFTRQQVIVMILLLCVFGIWMLWPSPHPHRTPRPAPPPVKKPAATSPLYVTVVPDESGWCCVDGKVSAVARADCSGTFFAQEAEAKRRCPAPTAPSGSPRGRGRGA